MTFANESLEALTLSGATGSQLKSELLQYLKKRGEEPVWMLSASLDFVMYQCYTCINRSDGLKCAWQGEKGRG